MPRIQPLSPPYAPTTVELLAKMMPEGVQVEPLAIFRTLARLPTLGKRLSGLGGALLSSPTLPLAIRELAIVRTTARLGAEYEWGVHVSWLAKAAGLGAEQVADTNRPAVSPACWSHEQRAVLAAVDALVDDATIDDEHFASLRRYLSEEAVLELVVVVGFYHLIAFVARAADLAPEPWAARFASPVQG